MNSKAFATLQMSHEGISPNPMNGPFVAKALNTQRQSQTWTIVELQYSENSHPKQRRLQAR
jgi:hypothetical protein